MQKHRNDFIHRTVSCVWNLHFWLHRSHVLLCPNTIHVLRVVRIPLKFDSVDRFDFPLCPWVSFLLFFKSVFQNSHFSPSQSLGHSSDRSGGWTACRSLWASAGPRRGCEGGVCPWISPGSEVYCSPLASSSRGTLWSRWSRSACPKWPVSGPRSPERGPSPRLGQTPAVRRWQTGTGTGGSAGASSPGA